MKKSRLALIKHFALVFVVCFVFCAISTIVCGCDTEPMKNQNEPIPDKTYVNPLFEGADPFILLSGGKYYLYCTSASDGYLYYVSDDLSTWECGGYCLRKEDVMGESKFWAPEVMERNGKFYMVYTSEEHLGIAVADRPEGPFVQTNQRWLSSRKAIDGHFFVDDDGTTYLYYVRFNNNNEIHAAKLEDDMTLDESSEVLILRTSLPWEQMDCDVAEGPFVLKRNGVYYLTYSVNHTRSPYYAIGCATSTNPLSGFEKYEEPILSKTDDVVGVGHHSFFKTKYGNLAIVYHSHFSPTQFTPRMVRIDKAAFIEENGKTRLTVESPTTQEVNIF